MDRTRSRRIAGALVAATALVATQLAAGSATPAAAAEDPLCSTAPASGDPFYNGPSASRVYDAHFRLGVPIPAGLLDGRYDPQGVAAWSNWNGTGEDLLLISAYEDTNGDKEPDGPSAVFGVVASGSRHGQGLGRMLIGQGHVGGLAVYGGWLYVGSEANIRGYRLSTLKSELQGANTSTVQPTAYNRPSSFTVGFMGTGDGHLWAGAFDEDTSTHLNGYAQSSRTTGALSYDDSLQAYAPKKTQGVTVTSQRVIFSTSFKRTDRGNIWVMPRGQQTLTDANSYCFRAPSMNEGITQLNGRLYLGFESAAYTYNHTSDVPVNRVRWVHSADTSDVAALYGRAD